MSERSLIYCGRMSSRARALSPEQRRAALVAAAVPLVVQGGLSVTTREIAAAAGVAEGTIFRVFESKDDLLVAAAQRVFDTTVLEQELAHIRPELDLTTRLTQIVEVNQAAGQRIMAVLTAFGRPCDRDRLGDVRALVDEAGQVRARHRIAELLAPDAARLRRSVDEVVALVGALSWMSVHPMSPWPRSSAADIVDLLLHGVLGDSTTDSPGLRPTPSPTPPTKGSSGNPVDPHPASGSRLPRRHTEREK